MMMSGFARNNTERRVLLNTIGPVWDGNEVWLITAGAATFAAFPPWYAALFSGPLPALVLVLLALIFRAVGIEYRGKVDSDRWRSGWDWAIALGSLVAAFGVGAMLALTTTGLPLDANGDRVGGRVRLVQRLRRARRAGRGGLLPGARGGVPGASETDGDVRLRPRHCVLPLAAGGAAADGRLGRGAAYCATAQAVTVSDLLVAAAGRSPRMAADQRPGRTGSPSPGSASSWSPAATIFTCGLSHGAPSTLDEAFSLTVDPSLVLRLHARA